MLLRGRLRARGGVRRGDAVAVGDSIVPRIETVPGPPTWQPMNIVVTTDAGELLAMNGVSAPPGWAVDDAGEVRRVDRGDHDEVEQYVELSHGGQRVVTEGGHWRRLTSPDGTWWVAGSARDLEGSELPADGGPSWSMMIVRARRPRGQVRDRSRAIAWAMRAYRRIKPRAAVVR